jgi:hypothetical protein
MRFLAMINRKREKEGDCLKDMVSCLEDTLGGLRSGVRHGIM